MIKVSYFKNTFQPYLTIPLAPEGKNRIHIPYSNADLTEILKRIQAGYWEKLTLGLKDGKTTKQQLPCFAPSGVFIMRNDHSLHEYSKVICLDYDNCTSVFKTKLAAAKIESTLSAFYSPSLKGVKVLVLVNSLSYLHLEAYKQVKEYYDQLLGMESDKRCKNLSRICYVSTDRDLFYNENVKAFAVVMKREPDQFNEATFSESIQEVINFTEKKAGAYYAGNQNNFLFAMACNMNRFGYSQNDCIEACRRLHDSQSTDFDDSQLLRTVQSAYKNKTEHGKFKLPKQQ